METLNIQPTKKASAPKKAKTIEEIYTKKSQLEHILLRPDTYIGSTEKHTQPMWVLDAETKKIVNRPITYVPGLFKIFDEIIVNAADNRQRDPTMNKIDVVINPVENFIRVWNNGNGIPVTIHKEHNVYVPELIFGHLLTGSNFDDNEEKTTGGRNGYGSKLCNIFSTKFIIETADKTRGLLYRQEFTNNMSNKGTPSVVNHSGSDYTSITFYPDLDRFKMTSLDEDIVALLSKRVYDIAGTNGTGGVKLNVFLNGQKLDVRNFEQYLGLYENIEAPIAFEKISDRWEVGVGISDGSFQQISFVNSISTTKGGQHVNYIADQIISKLAAVVKKKNKGEEVKPNQIKNHLAVFVNALIVNPAFDSQTKENLTTKASSFGSTCSVPEKMLKSIEKSNLIDNILNWAKFKQTAELKKKSGSKRSKIVGITKLDDANYAGTSKSSQCTLILTEGDSAKALAISGLGVVGRDFYGVFPLKGKLLNVREASHAQIMKNEEIQNIAQILGLSFGKEYTDLASLRYGHLMIMTDQDQDGSHIKGLLINFIHYFWPSLLKIDGFMQQFITPIVKCSKSSKELSFFTLPQYKQWKLLNNDGKGWKIKYYKGLGTSTAAEAKEYFSNLDIHEKTFEYNDNVDDVIDLAFAKKRVDDRKTWLLKMEPDVHIDYSADSISYDNFVNHELILFSQADNQRSIAHFMDGMKPSQRKVLFSCFKRNLKQEIKVAQLAGYVSEHSAYHHGEASLTQTIIGMAQNFVGSNNINLLSPCGQFGTRLMGGKDAASPRYVFTKLENITRIIFHPDDDPLLEYLDDDGQSIEPVHYVPIIPMVLVNGCEGIGTGWSSSVPTFNPREIISNLKKMINGEEPSDMMPWYRGFTGTIQEKSSKDSPSYTVTGIVDQIDEQTFKISELPVGKWTTDYKQYLESVLIGNTSAKDKEEGATNTTPFVKDFRENHTDTSVLFTVSCPPEKVTEFSSSTSAIIKKFKLDTSVSTSNMVLFDLSSQLRRFEGPLEILKDFFKIRMTYYDYRKALLIKKLTEDWEKLNNKVNFLMAVINGDIIVSNRKKVELLNELKIKGFKAFYDKKNVQKDQDGTDEIEEDDSSIEKGYDYLLSMKLWNLTMEKVQELTKQRNEKKAELDILRAKLPETLWLEDLDALETSLEEFEAAIDESMAQELSAKKKAAKHQANGNKKKAAKKVIKLDSDDDDDSDDDMDIEDESDYEDRKPKAKPKAKPVPKAAAPTKSAGVIESKTKASTASTASVSKPTSSVVASTFKSTTTSTSNVTKLIESSTEAPKAKSTSSYDIKENEIVSLMDRLKMRASNDVSKATSAPKTVIEIDSDKENGNKLPDKTFSSLPIPAPIQATSRPSKAKVIKKSKSYESEDEDEDDFEDSEFDEDDDDDEEFSEDEKPKKKAISKKSAPVAASKKNEKKSEKSKSSPIISKGVKRAQKDANAKSAEVYSPMAPTPKPTKKPRAKKESTVAQSTKQAAAKKTSAKSSSVPTKASKVSKKILESEDEDDLVDSPVLARKSPKPARARKPLNYANFFDEDEDDSFIVDESEEEEDDDESEFDD